MAERYGQIGQSGKTLDRVPGDLALEGAGFDIINSTGSRSIQRGGSVG